MGCIIAPLFTLLLGVFFSSFSTPPAGIKDADNQDDCGAEEI